MAKSTVVGLDEFRLHMRGLEDILLVLRQVYGKGR